MGDVGESLVMPTVTRTSPGDHALGCAHVDPDDLNDLYLIEILSSKEHRGAEVCRTPEGDDVQGNIITAKWMFACDECYELGEPFEDQMVQDFTVDRCFEVKTS